MRATEWPVNTTIVLCTLRDPSDSVYEAPFIARVTEYFAILCLYHKLILSDLSLVYRAHPWLYVHQI